METFALQLGGALRLGPGQGMLITVKFDSTGITDSIYAFSDNDDHGPDGGASLARIYHFTTNTNAACHAPYRRH